MIKFRKPAAIEATWNLAVQLRWMDETRKTWIVGEVMLPKMWIRDKYPNIAPRTLDPRPCALTLHYLRYQAERGYQG